MSIKDIEGAVRLNNIDRDAGVVTPTVMELKSTYKRLLKKSPGLSGWLSLASFRRMIKEQIVAEKLLRAEKYFK